MQILKVGRGDTFVLSPVPLVNSLSWQRWSQCDTLGRLKSNGDDKC